MERYTFPNQRFVCVHRERPTANFLGIKNENWMAAARDLTPHALLLYLYFAANANNYVLAVSPAAIRQAVGMPRSTYHDQFHVLEDKGYLIPTKGNTFDFFEVPSPRTVTNDEKMSAWRQKHNPHARSILSAAFSSLRRSTGRRCDPNACENTPQGKCPPH